MLAPGVTVAERALTADALRILGGAMVLQLAAAGMATLLAVWGRFVPIFGGYVAGSAAGTTAFFALRGPTGELCMAWSMLVMAVVTAGWLFVGMQRARTERVPGRPAPIVHLAAQAGRIVSRSAVALLFNGLYVVTLAFATRAAPGDSTVLSYAYLFVSYLVAFTGVSVGIARAADITRGAQDWRNLVEDTLPHGFRYALLVCAPAVAGLVAGGATTLAALLPDALSAADADNLRLFALLLVPWMGAALLVNLLVPSLFALGRARTLTTLAFAMAVVHVVLTYGAETAWGVDGTVGAFFVAPLAYGIALLVTEIGARSTAVARVMLADVARFGGAAVLAFGLGWAAGGLVGDGLATGLVALAVGGIAYAGLVAVLAPRQVAVLLGRASDGAST